MRTTQKMSGKMAVSVLLLVFTLLLQVALSLDGDRSSNCLSRNFDHDCGESGVCRLSVSWRRRAEGEFSVWLSALAPEPTKDSSWRVELSLARSSLKGEFVCGWGDGETYYNCSVGCAVANITHHISSVECRFSVVSDGVWEELISEPVSLHISSGNGSTAVHQAESKCRCDFTDCQNSCNSCVALSHEDDLCHSPLSLLLIRSHAILMVVTFLLLLPVGFSISRYSRPAFPYSWFRAHAVTNSAALLLMLLGLGAVLGHTKGTFTVGLHQIVGVVCIAFVLFQALCGYTRPSTGVSMQRRVFNIVHRTCGMVILGLGTLAMILGSVMYHNSVYPLVVLVLVAAVVVEVLFFLGMELIMRRNYMISVPVGYQRVDGADEDEGETGEKGEQGRGKGEEGEGEKCGSEKHQLCVMDGKQNETHTPTDGKGKSKPHHSHKATKRILEAFVVQAFLFSATVAVLVSYGSH